MVICTGLPYDICMKEITFITGNANKAAHVAAWLSYPLNHRQLDLPEIQSLDVREVVAEKAKAAYEIVKQSVLVEDVAMQLPALGRLPGPFVKWFEEELGLEGVCHLLDAFKDRSAIVTCCYGLFDGENMHFFEAVMEGELADQPRGDRGFGFDPAFINKGYTKTRGEMTETEYETTSMRKDALDTLAAFLRRQDNV